MSRSRRNTVRLVVAGGGTGGHTYPALTTVQAVTRILNERGTTLDATWFGTSTGLENRIARENGIPFRALAAGKVRRSLRPSALARTALDMLKVPFGIAQAVASLARHRPDAVLSTGGYVAVPVGLAARLTGRRLVMHEQIITLGLANRVLARFATAIAVSHPSSLNTLPPRARRRAVVTGNPIRPALLGGRRAAAHVDYGLDPILPLVYVTGGAQGSAQINRLLAQVLPDLLEHCQILHQCGPDNHDAVRASAASLPAALAHRYHLVPYVSGNLADVYAAAALVVARSGAGTLAELTALSLPSVLIPLVPTAGHEQQRGAEALQDAGAAVALVGEQATGERLREVLLPLLKDPGRLADMRQAARALGRPDAARQLAELVIAHTPAGRR
ncbi:glycosyltransferase [Kitasatospora sp. NRRL B-11411]|uniref:UDP-N-acetylglucosamine--N-acetylmuramyl- (pentapeptide) pyrophosphoryl-undecaprenol N-acetylglucosamine transferase n=1 Tax=Kitasatospora sp. NRRL B-11411 TaxID=1463822 RepID=UPI0004C2E96A|nr:UDP-N-acetylglucosamine--N-acetylmuramyl-(pentapeptide) pyrophosphoryl-undecaprenol N-acetylglucosamine transferase [Kitasatospora sp. NRRL B-11411]